MNNSDLADLLEVMQLMGLYLGMQKSKRRGVHRILHMRRSRGQFYTLFRELKQDAAKFRRYTRMSFESFEKLLEILRPKLRRNSARRPISPEQRLVVCLRFLATGASFRQLHFDFFLGETTVRRICEETCRAIQEVLGPIYVRMPSTEQEWADIAADFWERWQLPNCIGAIDGKHVQMRAPANTGSLYFNYKKHFSTVLLAVADANYRVLHASVGSYGHKSDAGIFDRSDFGRAMKDAANPLGIPGPSALPGSQLECTHFFVGDGAFPHHKHLMKPFPMRNLSDERRIYNYRISRGRRVIESTFGIMAARWRLLLKSIETSPDHSDDIVRAIICLHNFLIDQGDVQRNKSGDDDTDESGLRTAANLRNPMANHAGQGADRTRDALMEFFNGVGAVTWQNEYARIDFDADNDE